MSQLKCVLAVATLLSFLCVDRSALAQPQRIHGSRPLKVGDKFHLEGSTENTKQRRVTASIEGQPDLDLTVSVEYAYDVEVLAVADGLPTRQRCTIRRLISDAGEGKRSMIGGPPVVIAYRHDNGFTKIDVQEGTLPDDALGALYDVIHLESQRFMPEALVASDQARSVGESWPIDPKVAIGFLSERKLAVDPQSLRATARLVSVETVDGVTHQKLEATLTSGRLKLEGVVPDSLTMTKSGLDARLTIILPQDVSQPVSGLTTDMTVTYTGRGGQGAVPIKAEHTARIRESWTRTPLP